MNITEDKSWDDSLKNLVDANPQAFVEWLLGKGEFRGKLPYQLKNWRLEVDALLKVEVEDEEMLLEIEFQTYHDSDMAERLLRYNVLARSEYKLPVLSVVIYLLKDGNVPQSPLIWKIPTGKGVLEFYFESIELGDISPVELISIGQPGLLPLLPLTKDGANRKVAETMFTELEAAGKTELIPIGGTLASYIFSKKDTNDLVWLQRRLHSMRDIFRESPYYQEILKEGLEEGLEKGREEGREEGQLEALRQTVIEIVLERFPRLLRTARKQTIFTEDPAALLRVIVKLSMSQTTEEAKQHLLEMDEEDEED
ncbi:MAG TPA: hypothetical protein VFQ36_12670 [Ktedonobacteraceae bacterium]|nr:hypothetical protein [Ktedonobacteraceae bacterium]